MESNKRRSSSHSRSTSRHLHDTAPPRYDQSRPTASPLTVNSGKRPTSDEDIHETFEEIEDIQRNPHQTESKPGTGFPRSDSNHLDIVKCNTILSEVEDLVEPGCNLRFHNISPQEHRYIEDQLKDLEIRVRLACFGDLEHFIVMMPHDTHQALIVPFITGMSASFSGVPLSRGPYTIAVEVAPNASIDCQTSSFMPDLCVQICSLTGSDDPALTTMCPYIFIETVFLQSERDVMKKLEGYITHNPHTLAVFKIKIKETYNAPSQPPSSSNVKHFMGRAVLTEVEFKRNSERRILAVVRDGITWINVTGVELHLWLRLGETPIDLLVAHPNHAETAYATCTLHPTRSTADLDVLIDRMMNEFKKIIIQYTEDTLVSVSPTPSDLDLECQQCDLNEEGRRVWLDDISSWTPQNPLFDWDYIAARLTVSL